MDVADFDFELPDELIAQEPAAERGGSRLLVLDRKTGETEDVSFADLGRYLRRGDVLALNNTRVFPARVLGRRVPSGGEVECLLMRQCPLPFPTPDSPLSQELPTPNCQLPQEAATECWEALVHPGQKLKPGARVLFEGEGTRLHGEVLDRRFFGRRTVRLWTEGSPSVRAAVDALGHVPLPPYIKRDDHASDRDRYQTVYARDRGSIAAPTAGLHFTESLLRDLEARGISPIEITLHVGYGTFKPVRAGRVEDHVVDAETIRVGPEAAATLTSALRDGRRVIAVGTTTTRALESLTVESGKVQPMAGETTLFIKPGYTFQIVQGLVTNFHLPRSSLLMLVSAFAGRDRILAAYRHAVAARYRFYSYGDAMLIV